MGDGWMQWAAGWGRQRARRVPSRLGQETEACAPAPPPPPQKKGLRHMKIRIETELLSKGAVSATHHY